MYITLFPISFPPVISLNILAHILLIAYLFCLDWWCKSKLHLSKPSAESLVRRNSSPGYLSQLSIIWRCSFCRILCLQYNNYWVVIDVCGLKPYHVGSTTHFAVSEMSQIINITVQRDNMTLFQGSPEVSEVAVDCFRYPVLRIKVAAVINTR